MAFKVKTDLVIYEIDGDETSPIDKSVTIESHWNQNGVNGFVVIKFEGKSVTVAGRDLMAAAERCLDVS